MPGNSPSLGAILMFRWASISVGLLLAGLMALAALYPEFAVAQEPQVIRDGEEDYRWHCAACHGDDGRGRGAMAAMLVVPPANLTRVSQRQGGTFPFWQVYAMISGKSAVDGHQTFQMPEYWERFRRDEAKPGYLPAYIRILLLTHYLESIQVTD